MANLARFSTLDTALDDLMRGFFVRPMNYEPAAPVQMKVDVTENETGYLVRAEIPKDELEEAALNDERIKPLVAGAKSLKVIVVPNKLVNIVLK